MIIVHSCQNVCCSLQVITHFFWIKVKERPDIGVYVKDLSSYVMNNADDLDKTMTLGNKNRECSFTVRAIWVLLLIESTVR